jgi:hypothetical protein
VHRDGRKAVFLEQLEQRREIDRRARANAPRSADFSTSASSGSVALLISKVARVVACTAMVNAASPGGWLFSATLR